VLEGKYTDVGESECKIDIAVIHPETNHYVIGIECDGPDYTSLRTARDRDRLRDEVLRNQGWNIHRIWSDQWYVNPADVKSKLIKAIESAFSSHYSDVDRITRELKTTISVEEEKVKWNKIISPLVKTVQKTEKPATTLGPKYKKARVPEAPIGLSLTKKYMYKREIKDRYRKLNDQIIHVISVESPIHREILQRRIIEGWNVSKLTAKAKAMINSVLADLVKKKAVYYQEEFYWESKDQKQEWMKIPVRDHSRVETPILCVAHEEIANLILRMMKECLSIDKSQLYEEICVFYGRKIPSAKTVRHLDIAFDLVKNSGKIKLVDDLWRWTGD